MITSTEGPVSEISKARRLFERGLLNIMQGAEDISGIPALVQALTALIDVEPSGHQVLHALIAWLDMRDRESADWSEEELILLRQMGRNIRSLERIGRSSEHLDAGSLPFSWVALGQQIQALRAEDASGTLQSGTVIFGSQDNAKAADHAGELLQQLHELRTAVQSWQQVQYDGQGLMPVGQAFQKVRQSCQQAGLGDGMEVAWAVENLLDRLSDGTLDLVSAHIEVVEEATALLAEIIPHAPEDPGGSIARAAQLDDAAYGRVVERADLLASGDVSEEIAVGDDQPTTAALLQDHLNRLSQLIEDTLSQAPPLSSDQVAALEALRRASAEVVGRFQADGERHP